MVYSTLLPDMLKAAFIHLSHLVTTLGGFPLQELGHLQEHGHFSLCFHRGVDPTASTTTLTPTAPKQPNR